MSLHDVNALNKAFFSKTSIIFEFRTLANCRLFLYSGFLYIYSQTGRNRYWRLNGKIFLPLESDKNIKSVPSLITVPSPEKVQNQSKSFILFNQQAFLVLIYINQKLFAIQKQFKPTKSRY